MNYTPGEWRASFHYPHSVYATDGKRPPTTTPIAQMTVPDQVEMEANSNLIAAAPDLYEACKGLMEVAEIAMPNAYFQSDSRVNLAREAIAKAELK